MFQQRQSARQSPQLVRAGTKFDFCNHGLSWPGLVLCLVGTLLLADAASAQAPRLGASASQQIQALIEEKKTRTAAQRKIASQLLYEIKRRRGDPIFDAVPSLRVTLDVDRAGRTLVDIRAEVSEGLLRRIELLGGSVVNSFPEYQAIRAELPLMRLEALAASPEVVTIRPADTFMTDKTNTSEGDIAHQADQARRLFGVNGKGIVVCVLSDSVDHLAALQSSGDLPFNVFLLPGQSGVPDTSEGTAMLEIAHDLAPAADLGFATAKGGRAQFASNIIDLHAKGCKVIVDDVFYFAQPVFQDGIVAAAVDKVVAGGAVYFSSAGNAGNLNDGTSGVWEGDFVPTLLPPGIPTGKAEAANDFGGGNACNRIIKDTEFVFNLKWSDPQGGSANDYDLFLLDRECQKVIASSTNLQSGVENPYEQIDSSEADYEGHYLVIVQNGGAQGRYLHLNTNRGVLAIATDGQTGGHKAARGAFGVAAVEWPRDPLGAPMPFTGTESVETFSSDGPRRVFFEANGTAITPGNFSSSGGELRRKPDITAADGVSTATPDPTPGDLHNPFNPFYGTSAAAPHGAAIAALMLSANPALTVKDIRAIFTSSALDIEAPGVDRDSGVGIIDALAAVKQAAATAAIARYDFDGDGRSDIFWRNPSTGGSMLWLMDGFNVRARGSIGNVQTWKALGVGDFNGDRKADIYWRHAKNGQNAIWLMDGLRVLAFQSIGFVPYDWDMAGIGDFNGDGKADILWRHLTRGVNVIWFMDRFTVTARAKIPPAVLGWEVAGVDDFNNDLLADILWRNTGRGKNRIWLMNGSTVVSNGPTDKADRLWHVAGTGDFDRTSKADIVWRNLSTAGTQIWEMDGQAVVAKHNPGFSGSQWRGRRFGDYDRSGGADVLWRDIKTGATRIWLMKGFAQQAAQNIGTPSLAWVIK